MEPQKLLQRYDELYGVKQNWLNHYQDIVTYMMPYRQAMFFKNTPGAKTMSRIMDSSPIYAQFLFAAGLHGMMTNPTSPWFSLAMKEKAFNQLHPVKMWLYEVEQIIYDLINTSNFATQANEAYLDYGGFGMFVMFMAEDDENTYSFNTLHLGEVVVGENSKGKVDTFMRLYEQSARQIYQDFGEECSPKVIKAAKDPAQCEKKFEILHAVLPRQDYNPASRLSSQLPIASIYLEKESKKVLSTKGFHEFPVMAPRFSVSTGEVYGRGPGMIALPDVKQLNQMEEDMMRAAQKKIDPPIMYAKDSFTGPIRFVPGGASIVRGTSVTDKMAPFPVPGDLGYGEKKEEQKRENIGRIFYNNMLQLVQQDRMTATEVMQRSEEKLRLMGPMLGRLQFEFLAPLIDRGFGIAYRRRLLPPIPDVIRGRDFHAKFISPLAKAQRLQEAQGISRTLEITMPVMQIRPEIGDNFDWDKVVRIVAEVNAVPAVAMKDPDLVTQEREARNKAIQEQQGAKALGEVSKATANLSQSMQPNSPMEAIMESLKGTAQAAQPELGVSQEGI